MWYTIAQELLFIFLYSVTSFFHHYIRKWFRLFFVVSCCYDDIKHFCGEIFACRPVFMLTHQLSCAVGHCCCTRDWASRCSLTAELQINSGPHKSRIFNPFPALLSNEFVTKTLKCPLIVWLQEHWMSESSSYVKGINKLSRSWIINLKATITVIYLLRMVSSAGKIFLNFIMLA